MPVSGKRDVDCVLPCRVSRFPEIVALCLDFFQENHFSLNSFDNLVHVIFLSLYVGESCDHSSIGSRPDIFRAIETFSVLIISWVRVVETWLNLTFKNI